MGKVAVRVSYKKQEWISSFDEANDGMPHPQKLFGCLA